MPLAFRVESRFVYYFFFSWLIYLSSPSHRRFGIHSHNNTNGDTWTEETGRPLYSEGFGRLRNPDVCLFWLISEAWDNFFSSSGNTNAGISLDQKHRFIRTEIKFLRPNSSGQCPSARIVRIPSNRGRRICGPCSKTIPPNSGD